MRPATPLNITVNARVYEVPTDPKRTLLEVLREDLTLTGTKYGCGEGACGACAVLIDGRKVLSCTTPVAEASGKSVTTIEGLALGDELHPAQRAFQEEEAFQCGYCTPGMIIATVALLGRTPSPSDEEIRGAMNEHLCRCCGYARTVDAVKRAAELAQK
jgi:aerobic-type carbon monoxide dehydrogenase small subunit (CoxS/CutS family)